MIFFLFLFFEPQLLQDEGAGFSDSVLKEMFAGSILYSNHYSGTTIICFSILKLKRVVMKG